MTQKRILRFAPLMIAALLLLTAVVIALLPHGGASDFVSETAALAIHR